MPRAKTTADLLTELRARVSAPAANGLLDPDELIELADQEQRSEIASILIGVRSEYWLTSYTTSITSGLAEYRVPDRALGMGLRVLTIYDANGREWDVPQVDASRRYEFAAGNSGQCDPARAFTFENGTLTLLPTPSVSGYTLRLRYYTTPPTLTAVTNAAAIQVASTTTTLTVFEAPTNTDLSGGDVYIDVYRGAGMSEALTAGNLVTDYTTLVFTLTDPIVVADFASHSGLSTPRPGERVDYITVAGTTVYPPIPEVLWPVLLTATTRSYYEAIGDTRGLEAAAAIFDRRKRMALDVLQPRVDGQPVQAIPLDTPLRNGRGRAGGWWY